MSDRPLGAAAIRQAFLDFYASRGHTVVPSGPLVPPNDPSLYFANSGMVQFKDLFTGREQRAYRRAASSQKCMRVSGKHNDLETVGASPNHHTFFEMLGNFSFGDYFKEEAILSAWTFVTGVLGLPKERLLVTHLRGDQDLPEDLEARRLWKSIAGLPDERILRCGPADNFWRMGDTGPCGPCTEIFYFRGDDIDVGRFDEPTRPDGSGWMEIWNLVFMQFERTTEGKLVALPAPSVDTGMGLERITRVIQGVGSNYDTDLFRPLIAKIEQLSGKAYRGSSSPDDVSMRVIADHARATAFLIGDGVLPDRAGRSYVLRRVMRRAIRHGHRLGIDKPFLYGVAEAVVEHMGSHYQDLRERRALITSVAEQEEVRFRETIGRGLGLLEHCFSDLSAKGQTVLGGADAFRLYDTFGFPLDLTEVICAERGFSVDSAGYENAMEQARQRSEFRGVGETVAQVYQQALAEVSGGQVTFSGYDALSLDSQVVAVIQGGQLVSALHEGVEGEVVTLATPFYGESGGQVGDTGVITFAGGRFEVQDTQKPVTGLVVHRGRLVRGGLKPGDRVRLEVDPEKRASTRRNHSATHLLHHSLRQVLGAGAQQKGSLVGPERLRFDFTFGAALSDAQIAAIEDGVNRLIADNHPVETEVLTLEQARQRGAMMLFEEKYGETVRMLRMGPSLELCGGTHARSTGEIGIIKILQEQGVAAGVRRISAVTGPGVMAHVRELEATLEQAAQALKGSRTDLVERVQRLVTQNRALEKQLAEQQRKWMSGGTGGGIESLVAQAREVGGVKVLATKTDVTDRAALRELAEQLRDKLGPAIVLVGSVHEDKVQLVLTVAKPLTERYKAGQLIRGIAERVGGSGGGRPDLAQAGGTQVAELDAALESLYGSVGAS